MGLQAGDQESLERRLRDPSEPLLLDGGLSTELERRGADISTHLWSAKLLIDNPSLIEDTHLAYFESGADVAITASYQASQHGFSKINVSPEETNNLLRSSVSLARSAATRSRAGRSAEAQGRPLLVAASVGCYGASLADGSEYRGEYTLSVEELKDFHRPRVLALVSAGPDALAFETVPCLSEARAILQLLDEDLIRGAGVEAWLSVSCKDGASLNSGESVEDLVTLISESSAARPGGLLVAVGVNCTAPQHITPLLGILRGQPLPLLTYPNKGEEWDAAARAFLPGTATSDDVFCEQAAEWIAAGAKAVGGCCRTTPDTIRALRATLRKE